MMIRFFTVSQVADRYGLSADKVYRDIKRGVLPAVSVGGAVRVREPDLQGYLKDYTPSSPRVNGRRD